MTEPPETTEAKKTRGWQKSKTKFEDAMLSEDILATLPRGGRSTLMIRDVAFKDGKRTIDLRLFIDGLPTRKGIALRPEELAGVIDVLKSVEVP